VDKKMVFESKNGYKTGSFHYYCGPMVMPWPSTSPVIDRMVRRRFALLPRKRVLLAGFILLIVAYTVTPYLMLLRLADALRHGDSRMLETTIDWDSVREGVKEDIADGIVGDGAPDPDAAPVPSNTLPPFGASFVKGIAGREIDRELTPQHLAAIFREVQPAGGNIATLLYHDVRYAFFDGPKSFRLSLHCPGQAPGDPPLRVEMALQHGTWTVVRAWLPRTMLESGRPSG
jgi:Protein of unknown function (DUF2939)